MDLIEDYDDWKLSAPSPYDPDESRLPDDDSDYLRDFDRDYRRPPYHDAPLARSPHAS